MKHIRWQMLIAALGIAFLSVLLGYLSLNTTSIERPDVGGTYIEGMIGRPNAVNPMMLYNDVDRDLAALVFNGLTRAAENDNLQPDLALRWTISPDSLVYTFTLRSNIKWHDGAPLTVNDQIEGCEALPGVATDREGGASRIRHSVPGGRGRARRTTSKGTRYKIKAGKERIRD